MSNALLKRLERIEPLALASAGQLESSVYGVVDKVVNGKPHIIRKWEGTIGNMKKTRKKPTILLIEKLEPMILKHKKYKLMYGGRAGTKSRFAQDVMSGDVNSNGSRVYVLRERMKSLKESIYAGIKKSINDLNVSGFVPVPSHWEIRHRNGGVFTFGGMQNIIDMKGASNYKFFLMEEAARTSQQTIDTLGPTLRDTPGAELWWLWNPESSTDPMSQEFIVPYQAYIDKQGYYEDEYHLIIKVGFEDNPWFMEDDSLRTEYEKDCRKVKNKMMSTARFNHIWNGDFLDSVGSSVIETDWFDASIDAHKKLGFEAKGAVVAACDPSDVGNDPTGFAVRKGVVFHNVKEIEGENGNRKFDIACRDSKLEGCDSFGFDADGLGAILRDQAATNFSNTKVNVFMYKGSEKVHAPDSIFKDCDSFNIKGQKKNKDVFANKKAQNIAALATRFRLTYEAVAGGVYHDPDNLISFCSEGISQELMSKLRAECCKVPLKPADTIKFYSKEEMRKGIIQPDGTRIKIPSPNLFDSVVLSFDKASLINHVEHEDINFVSCF